MNGTKQMATRIVNAEESFISSVMDQFDKTYEESEKVLAVFKKAKAVRIDPVGGQFRLTSGLFWEADVINNALSS